MLKDDFDLLTKTAGNDVSNSIEESLDNGVSTLIEEFLSSCSNRKIGMTLLYGYDSDRNTLHVYLTPGATELVVHHYSPAATLSVRRHTTRFGTAGFNEISSIESLVPNKRLYPEACDFRFSKLLKERGIHLPFTVFTDRDKTVAGYWGELATPVDMEG